MDYGKYIKLPHTQHARSQHHLGLEFLAKGEQPALGRCELRESR